MLGSSAVDIGSSSVALDPLAVDLGNFGVDIGLPSVALLQGSKQERLGQQGRLCRRPRSPAAARGDLHRTRSGNMSGRSGSIAPRRSPSPRRSHRRRRRALPPPERRRPRLGRGGSGRGRRLGGEARGVGGLLVGTRFSRCCFCLLAWCILCFSTVTYSFPISFSTAAHSFLTSFSTCRLDSPSLLVRSLPPRDPWRGCFWISFSTATYSFSISFSTCRVVCRCLWLLGLSGC